MTKEDNIKYWTELSDYDLITADAILQTKRYLYVGFMCHQVIEKIFKACYSKYQEDNVPFTHGLQYLAEKSGFWNKLSIEHQQFISILEPMNIKTRYPDYKNNLAKNLTYMVCYDILTKTQDLQKWIKEKLL